MFAVIFRCPVCDRRSRCPAGRARHECPQCRTHFLPTGRTVSLASHKDAYRILFRPE